MHFSTCSPHESFIKLCLLSFSHISKERLWNVQKIIFDGFMKRVCKMAPITCLSEGKFKNLKFNASISNSLPYA